MIEKILFAYTTDSFCGSLDTEPVSWFWFADPHFMWFCPSLAHLLVDLGWVDFDLGLAHLAQPLLPNSHQPWQN